MKKRFIFLFTALGYAVLLSAQPYVDVLKLRYRYFPQVAYIEDDSAGLTTMQATAEFFLPLELKSKDVIIVGGSLDRTHLAYDRGDSSASELLYSAALQLGGIIQWNDRWKTMLIAIPRFSSDFQEFSGKYFQMGGVMLFTFKKGENLKYKFGLYYNREFFGNYFMPLAGIEWNVNDRLNLFGVLPGSLNLEYKLKERFYTGLSYRSLAASYRLSDAPSDYYAREGHTFLGHNQLWAFVDFYLLPNVPLSIGAGHTAWRQFDFYDNNKETVDINPVYQPFNDGFFVHAELAYRIRLDK